MSETQASVCEWAEATFGPVSSNARVCARANEEMAELLRALTSDNLAKVPEEAADVVIVLYRLGQRLGVEIVIEPVEIQRNWDTLYIALIANDHMALLLRCLAINDNNQQAKFPLYHLVKCPATLVQHLGSDLQTEIDRKMQTNRSRTWLPDKTGHGYHVRPKPV